MSSMSRNQCTMKIPGHCKIKENFSLLFVPGKSFLLYKIIHYRNTVISVFYIRHHKNHYFHRVVPFSRIPGTFRITPGLTLFLQSLLPLLSLVTSTRNFTIIIKWSTSYPPKKSVFPIGFGSRSEHFHILLN